MRMKVFRGAFFLTAACGWMLFAAGCRSVPITDRTQFLLTSSEYENELGVSAYEEYRQQYPVSGNKTYNQALDRCGNAIAAVAGENDFQWQFTVLESEEQNAFCLPGGKVAVYTGLMDLMKNEAELAFVVGHEIGHAIARHGGERMSWGYLQSLGGQLISEKWHSEVVDGIYGTGTQLGVMLPFSRSNESEADYIGLILMARAGYDPHASVEFWSRFSQDAGTGTLVNLMSTHPCDSVRIQAMKDNMAAAEGVYNQAADKKGYGIIFR